MATAWVRRKSTGRKQVLQDYDLPLIDPGILKSKRILLAENLDVEVVLAVLTPYMYYSQADAINAETNRGSKIGKLIDTLQRLSVKNYNLLNTFLRIIGGVQPDLFSELVGRAPTEIEADICVEKYAHSLRDSIQSKGHCIDSPLDEQIEFDSEHIQLAIVQDKPETGAFNELPHRYQTYLAKVQDGRCNVSAVKVLDSIRSDAKTKRVSLYGRAGTGKTTTFQWLAREWSLNQWAPQFTLLFLVQLRMLSVSDHHMTVIELLTLAGLYQVTEVGLVVPLLSWLKHAMERVLILMDGLDEVSGFAARLRNCPIISDLKQSAHPIDLCLNIMRGNLLPGVTIVSASRPFPGLDSLQFDKKFEILGLTESRVHEFICRKHPTKAADIMAVLTNSPLLMSVCSITFYCVLISRLLADGVIFQQDDLQTYTRLMAFLIVQCVERKLPDWCFLIQVRTYFHKLAHMAYLGVFERQLEGGLTKLVFNESDIVQTGLTPQDLKYVQEAGLLHVQSLKVGRRSCISAEFVHFSVQEMLASAHFLLEFPVSDNIFSRLFSGGQLNMAFLYMFGLQHDTGSEWVQVIRHSVQPSYQGPRHNIERQMNEYIQNVIQTCHGQKGFGSQLQICQLLYEGQMEDKAKSVVEHVVPNGRLTIEKAQMTLIDLMAVWFVCKYAEGITELCLSGCGLTDILLGYITSSFLKAAEKLRVLELGDNEIGVQGASDIAEWLRETHTLHTLDLFRNKIGDSGAMAIAAALQNNSTVQTLYAGGNSIGDVGATAMAGALQNSAVLKTLYLGHNNISDSGARAIAAALQSNSRLQTLYIGHNNIGDSGATAIAAALKNNSTIQTLYIGGNNIADTGASAIAEALKKNRALKTLYIGHNNIAENVFNAMRCVKRQGLEIVSGSEGMLIWR